MFSQLSLGGMFISAGNRDYVFLETTRIFVQVCFHCVHHLTNYSLRLPFWTDKFMFVYRSRVQGSCTNGVEGLEWSILLSVLLIMR